MAIHTWDKTFSAKLEELPSMMEFVSGAAEEVGVHPKRIMHLQLAVEEATVNVCNYAYKVPPGELHISILHEPDKLVVKIIDEGVPFDPLSLETPELRAELEDRPVGGLGVYLMRRVMDEVHYFREGESNILSLTIKLEP